MASSSKDGGVWKTSSGSAGPTSTTRGSGSTTSTRRRGGEGRLRRDPVRLCPLPDRRRPRGDRSSRTRAEPQGRRRSTGSSSTPSGGCIRFACGSPRTCSASPPRATSGSARHPSGSAAYLMRSTRWSTHRTTTRANSTCSTRRRSRTRPSCTRSATSTPDARREGQDRRLAAGLLDQGRRTGSTRSASRSTRRGRCTQRASCSGTRPASTRRSARPPALAVDAARSADHPFFTFRSILDSPCGDTLSTCASLPRVVLLSPPPASSPPCPPTGGDVRSDAG